MNKSDKQQITAADRTAQKIDKLYKVIINEIVALTKSTKIKDVSDVAFLFSQYPILEVKIDELLNDFSSNVTDIIMQASAKEWNNAIEKNNGIITPYLQRKLLSEEQIKTYTNRNTEALNAFQTRKTNGLNLSDRVWKYTNQFKNELEMSLDLGLREGKSAQQISRDVRKYLNEPNALFRRVRDQHGNLHLSKRAQNYNPGQGVYRSSYKNAMRLARTEVNMAYRASDIEKYRQLDFVIGYEVRRSNHTYGCSVCESLKGKYPKDFQFVGWHPQCRCYTVPILRPLDEFIAELNEEEIETKTNAIEDVPDNFKQWAVDNKERMKNAQSVPYWWKDNEKYTNFNLQKEVNALIEKANKSKEYVEQIVKEIAEKYNGKVTGINLKTKNSIFRKVLTELNRDVSQVKDSVRTTIILTEENMQFFLADSKKMSIFTHLKIQLPEEFAGYSGILTNIKTSENIFAEIQFNTDKMIFTKEKPANAIRIIGKNRWEKIKKETGMEGGLGHLFYEEMRLLNKSSQKFLELKKKSEEYYSNFR